MAAARHALVRSATCAVLAALLLALGRADVQPAGACAAQGACGEEASLVQLHQQRERPAAQAVPAATPNASASERVRQDMVAERDYRTARVPRTTASYAKCKLSSCNSCKMSRMTGKRTLVFPGGKTSCLNGDQFAFFVTPGATDKLVLYFQAGGACWTQLTFDIQACTQSIQVAIQTSGTLGGQGIFNTADRRNGLRDYTIVEVLYCSGDIFVGNTTQSFNGSNPQVGFENILSVLAWVLRNTKAKLSSLVIAGASAGALGAQVWADHLLSKTFKYDAAAVLVDSYAGVFPDGTTALLLQAFGACDLPIFSLVEQVLCKTGFLTVRTITRKTICSHGSVPFGFLQSKADVIQRDLFNLVSLTFNFFDPMLSGPDLYFKTNTLFTSYNANPNFVELYVDGETHTFTTADFYFTAGTLGISSGSIDGQPLMFEWVNDLVDGGGCPSAQCAGQLSANNNGSTDFCDKNLFPKACAVSY